MKKDKLPLFMDLDGFNLNPIPLEVGQTLTTTKWLMSLTEKLNSIITFTNNWYDTIIKDFQENGTFSTMLNEELMKDINNKISEINNILTELKYSIPTITITSSDNNIHYYGETLNSLIISSNITGDNISKIEFYSNNTLIKTTTNSDNPYITLNNITDNTEIKAMLYDDKNIVTSNIINIIFKNKEFFGQTNKQEITENDIIKANELSHINNIDEGYCFILTDKERTIKLDNVDITNDFIKNNFNYNNHNYISYLSKYTTNELIKIEVI